LLVHHVGNRAVTGSNSGAEAPCDERASRSVSESRQGRDLVTLMQEGQPPEKGEACHHRGSNEPENPMGLPG
jgi:hypothetical protein